MPATRSIKSSKLWVNHSDLFWRISLEKKQFHVLEMKKMYIYWIFNDKNQLKKILSIFNYRKTLMTSSVICNIFCFIQTLEIFYINGTYFQHLQTIIEYKIGRGIVGFTLRCIMFGLGQKGLSHLAWSKFWPNLGSQETLTDFQENEAKKYI